LNAVIRGVVRKSFQEDIKIIGIKNGWKGMIECDYMDLDFHAIAGILPKGGTILGTSRTNPYKKQGDVEKSSIHIKNYNSTRL